MIANSLISIILSLSLTILIEWGLSFIFLKNKKDQKVVILAQIITNPTLNFVLLLNAYFFGANYYLLLGILEISIIIIEAIIYKNYLSKKVKVNPSLLSLLLNTASLSIGLLIQIK